MIGYTLRDNPVPNRLASEANQRAMRAETDMRQLEARLDALEMSCAALFKLLKERHGYSNDDLVQAIHAIDLEDGSLDGKVKRTTGVCPSCGRKLLSRSSIKCLWCGAQLTTNPLTG